MTTDMFRLSTIDKRNETKRQTSTSIYKTLHRKLTIEQNERYKEPVVKSGARER
jgi:hypothetical protein